jgi:hypothetical protein
MVLLYAALFRAELDAKRDAMRLRRARHAAEADPGSRRAVTRTPVTGDPGTRVAM